MGCSRYNDIIVCVSPDNFQYIIKAKPQSSHAFGICIRSHKDVDRLQEIIKEIFSLKTTSICLWIDEKIYREHEQQIAKLLFLLFSPSYLLQCDEALFYFVGSHSENYSEGKKALSKSISSLGFAHSIKDVECWTLSGAYDQQWFLQADSRGLPEDRLFSFYFDLLTLDFFVDKQIFVFASNEKKINEILNIIMETEEAVLQSNSRLHELFCQCRRQAKENIRLTHENRRLEIDLANQKKYLAVLRNEKEMEKIIAFYHKEYEVLPLWYKRLGHIIKLFTGKRKIWSTHHQK